MGWAPIKVAAGYIRLYIHGQNMAQMRLSPPIVFWSEAAVAQHAV